MEILPENPYLKYNADTLHDVRKLFNLEDPKRMEEAIDILQEWARKQNHFACKEFDRVFLEKIIISNKGLLERCKVKLDKYCTLRSLLPEFFAAMNVRTDFGNDFHKMIDAALPKMTPDNHRVYILQNCVQDVSSKILLDYYIRQVALWQYLQRHDYNAGYIIVYDLTESKMMALLTSVNLADFRKLTTILLEGFGSRINAIYTISSSKVVHTLVDLLKPMVSKKISDRLQFLNDRLALKTKLPLDILPSDYGGEEKSMAELHKEWLDVASSDEQIEYMKRMNELRTIETKRQLDKFNEEYLGMPGTFRTLSVD